MAKGWESKSVEAQMESRADEAAASDHEPDHRRLTPAEAEAERKKQNLLLARAQISASMAHSQNPRYREMLEKALADLDTEIAKL